MIGKLESRLKEEQTTPHEGTTTSSEVGSVIVRELEDARDEALEALDWKGEESFRCCK